MQLESLSDSDTRTQYPFSPCCAPFVLPTKKINGKICQTSMTSSGHRTSNSFISGQCLKPLLRACVGILPLCHGLIKGFTYLPIA